MFSEHALSLLRSAGEVLHPEPGELMWDAGDPYDLNLVLAGTAVVTGERRVMTAPTTRDLATALGIDLWGISDDSRCDVLVVGAGPAVIIASGVRYRRLDLPGLADLEERGRSARYPW